MNSIKKRALPGIEPGPPVPETGILPLNYKASTMKFFHIVLIVLFFEVGQTRFSLGVIKIIHKWIHLNKKISPFIYFIILHQIPLQKINIFPFHFRKQN